MYAIARARLAALSVSPKKGFVGTEGHEEIRVSRGPLEQMSLAALVVTVVPLGRELFFFAQDFDSLFRVLFAGLMVEMVAFLFLIWLGPVIKQNHPEELSIWLKDHLTYHFMCLCLFLTFFVSIP